MNKYLFSLVSAFALTASSYATVFLSLDGGVLRTSSGTAASDGGLILLVASTTDSIFTSPTATSSTTAGSVFAGDDIVLGSFSVSSVNAGFAGGYGTNLSLTYSGNVNAGDLLQLYWFPTLTTSNSTVGAGTSYGAYRTDNVSNGSTIGWVLPSDGATVTLNFFTTSAGGSVADSMGNASLTTVPEPATAIALLGGAAGLFVMHRRRNQRKTVAPVEVA